MSGKDPYSAEFEAKLLKSIKSHEGVVTVGDVSSDTGLPYNETEIGLRQLLSIYESHLDVDDSGNLRYRFVQPMVRRGVSAGLFFYKLKNVITKVLRWIFKIWTMVMLVGYTVIFILLLLTLMIVMSASNQNNNNSSRDDSFSGNGIFLLIARLADYLFWFRIMSPDRYAYHDTHQGFYQGVDRHGHKHRSEAPFYEKVNRFVFGPEAKEPSEEEKNQEFAQFVRSKGGIVTAADWAQFSGLSLDEADSFLTAGVGRFSGEVSVSDEGTLLYRFDDLKVTADGKRPRNVTFTPIWQKELKKPEFTGNKTKTNIGIGMMAAFVFTMSWLFLSASAIFTAELVSPEAHQIIQSTTTQIALGWIPFIYTLLFIAIPLFRLIPHLISLKKWKAEGSRREGMRKIWESTQFGQAVPVDLAPYDDKKLAVDFHGDVDIEAGEPTYFKFDEIAQQQYDATIARQRSNERVVFGESVYSSDDKLYCENQGELDDFDERMRAELGEENYSPVEESVSAYSKKRH